MRLFRHVLCLFTGPFRCASGRVRVDAAWPYPGVHRQRVSGRGTFADGCCHLGTITVDGKGSGNG